LHDALCVVRSLVKNPGLIPGGGAPEIELSQKLAEYSRGLGGVESLVVRAFADALEVIPYTLAENAGLSPIVVVTELRNRHIKGEKECGINVKKGICDNMLTENVIQPALVTQSALRLSTEVVRMILKIDDLVSIFVSVFKFLRFFQDKKCLAFMFMRNDVFLDIMKNFNLSSI
jgi:T-complex protein 1 subunit delta